MKGPITVNVYVTRADIARGRAASFCRCPVALAIRRRLPDADFVAAASTRAVARLALEGGQIVADFPDKVRAFIEEFDAGNASDVSPMRFTLTFTRG